MDLGYAGFAKDHGAGTIHMPVKKVGGKPLSEEQKEHNRQVNRVRVLVEHAIGGIKRFSILVNRFRNRLRDFEDLVIWMITGLHNLNVKLNN